jgi:hypothetical protein
MHFSLALIGVALLSRTTYVIPFLALLGMEFLSILKDRKFEWKRYILVVPIIVVFFLYRWHNEILRNDNGSMFLHRLTPAESMDEVSFLFNHIWDNWRFVYFSSVHYWSFAVVIASIIVSIFRKTLRRQSIGVLLSFIGIYLLGCFLFLAAMLKQFQDHDYYFLDTFYLPCILIVIALLAYAPKSVTKFSRVCYLILLLVFIGFAFRKSYRSQRSRHDDGVNNRLQNTISNYTGSAQYLDSLGIPRDATILILDAVAPNTALALMDRKGLVVLWTVKGMLEHAFYWDFDYIVFQNEYFQDQIYRGYPEILSRVKKLGTNGRITVCTTQEGNSQTLQEFLGMNGTPLYEETVDFELGDLGPWRGYRTTADVVKSGNRSAYFSKDDPSGLTMEWSDLDFMKTGNHPVAAGFWIKTDDIVDADVVFRLICNGRQILHEVRSIKDVIQPSTEWQYVDYSFVLPKVDGEDSRLSFYFVNRSPSPVYYDDVHIAIYP